MDAEGSEEVANVVSPAAGRPLTGQIVSHYRILEKLGEGGMGVVYKAEDIRLRRFVALKFPLSDVAGDTPSDAARAIGRFEREARAASALNHANICTIYEVEEFQGQPVIVMELLEGQSLKRRIQKGGVCADELVEWSIQIAGALEAAHARGIIHRDVKPANIFVTSSGNVKVLDFGLARNDAPAAAAQPDGAGPTLTIEEPLTAAGSAVGTLSHMSPEQIRAQPLDTRTDLFSFGVVLYEMATGQLPFRGASAGVVFDSILNREPARPGRLNPELPEDLERIIGKCLEKDRNLRYQHASDISTDLQRFRRDSGSGRIPVLTDASRLRPANGKRRWWIAAAAAGIAVCAGVWLLAGGLFHRKPKLTDRDTIVLADFTNRTGDPLFDGTLRQGLAVQLQQSPYLSLISDDRIQTALHLMEQPSGTRLTPELAREVCVRTGGAAVLEGSLTNLGSQYVVGLRAKNCNSGEVLDEEQKQAATKEEVLNALSRIAIDFRTRVGESLATIRKHQTPLPEAMTTSLDALKEYSQGVDVLSARGDNAAIAHFRRAVEIDPRFAIAHARLGLGYVDAGAIAHGVESITRAWQLRERASDTDRYFIDATYYIQVTGDLEKGRRTCEDWEQTYPRERDVHGFLAAMIYAPLGFYEKALAEATTMVRLYPDFSIGYLQLAFLRANLDMPKQSDDALKEAARRNLQIPELLMQRYLNAFLRGDEAAMRGAAAESRGQPAEEDWLDNAEAFTSAYSGKLRQAKEMSRTASELAVKGSQKDRAAMWEAGAAVREGLFGNKEAAKQRAVAALGFSGARDAAYGATLALALAGDSAGARQRLTAMQAALPDDTAVRYSYAPTIEGLIALNEGPKGAGKAFAALEIARLYELGSPPSSAFGAFGCLYPVYVRGLADLAAGNGADAALEFRKIVDRRGIVINDPVGAVAHLQLGRALILAGDSARGTAAYRDFFALWKEADPDIPVLREARAEFGRLPR